MSRPSPYPLRLKPDGTYQFVTSDQRAYTIYLTDGSAYLPDSPFSDCVLMIGFYQEDNSPRQHDERVSATIIRAIESIFSVNPHQILVYVCDTSDQRQRARMHLFSRWFRQVDNAYIHFKHEHIEPDFLHYAGLLIRADNPYRNEIQIEAEQFIIGKFS